MKGWLITKCVITILIFGCMFFGFAGDLITSDLGWMFMTIFLVGSFAMGEIDDLIDDLRELDEKK